jgi:hypothetical protein
MPDDRKTRPGKAEKAPPRLDISRFAAANRRRLSAPESSPDRSVAKFKKKQKKASGNERRGVPKDSKLIEIGD